MTHHTKTLLRSLPTLLRRVHAMYGRAMRQALDDADFGDVPEHGLSVLGGLAADRSTTRTARPLGQLIAELGMTKQAAGYLIDALVVRGYLQREPDPDDRRRLRIALTTRGRAAARVIGAARDHLHAQFAEQVGEAALERMQRTLNALAELELETSAADDSSARR